jgi:ribose 5-phosphate isomerase A
MNPKEAAAREAVKLIQDGMNIGLGSGTTVDYALALLGERVQQEGLHIRLTVASQRSEAAALKAGLQPVTLDDLGTLDLVIDGTDEWDPAFNLIKGGGAALVREKLLVKAGREFIVIADHTKRVPALGAFPLPIAIVPFGARYTTERLARWCPDLSIRTDAHGPVITDDGLNLVDIRFGRIEDPPALERELKAEVGVVEVGLFTGLVSRLIIGHADGSTEVVDQPG